MSLTFKSWVNPVKCHLGERNSSSKGLLGYEGRSQQDSIRAALPALFSMTVSSETYDVCVRIGSMRLLTAGPWRPPSTFLRIQGRQYLGTPGTHSQYLWTAQDFSSTSQMYTCIKMQILTH